MTEAEFAETVAELMAGNLGDAGRFCELQGWEVIGLDTGEIEIRTRHDGSFRLIVERFEE